MAPAEDARKLKVFISYSRADSVFADELAAGLEFARQFEVTIDRHSIVEGEDWKRRLGALITDADTVVFLLSPDSAKSEICGWEVEEAWRLSKRILPVLVRSIGTVPAPPQLAALNYVRFDEGRSFMAGLSGLVRALNTDVEWLREHTRLLARALEWESAGRAPIRLLSGSDIAEAKAWLARRPKDAPEATDAHLAYIRASEAAEADRDNAERKRLAEVAAAQAASASALAEREAAVKTLSRRTTVGIISAGGLTAAAAGLAWWGNDAERRFREERQKAEEAKQRAIEDAITKEAMRTDIAGQLLGFAAAPDQHALDGPEGGNSPFTQAVVAELADENASFQAALARATRKVSAFAAQSGHQQRPFLSTDLNGDVYLFRRPASRRLKALVISTDRVTAASTTYTLVNTERDAIAWESLLARAGFAVQRLVNPSLEECEVAIGKLPFTSPGSQGSTGSGGRGPTWRPAVSPLPDQRGDVNSGYVQKAASKPIETGPPADTLIFVFYSGIGFVVEGDNFMGLVSTRAERPDEVDATAVNLTLLQSRLRDYAAASILVMDTNFNRISDKPPRPTRLR